MPPNPQRPPFPPKPPQVAFESTPVEAFRPPAARRSEEAARAAQHVLDLENDLTQANSALAQLKNLLQLEEERNKRLTIELETTKVDRDYYQQRNTEIMTKLTIAGSVVLDAMKEPPGRENAAQRAEIQEAAARALRGDDTLTHDPPETGGHS